MRKLDLLNSDIARVIALMGHGDTICICDAGLPIPAGVERIDLAVLPGLPSFLDVMGTVTKELMVEHAFLATELDTAQPELKIRVVANLEKLSDAQNNQIVVESVSHEVFKKQTRHCRAIIRTGECSPFANVILSAGVTF